MLNEEEHICKAVETTYLLTWKKLTGLNFFISSPDLNVKPNVKALKKLKTFDPHGN